MMISYRFMMTGFIAVTLNLGSLTLGIICYVSLNFTDCRSNEAFFQAWWRWWQFAILVGYIVFAAATSAFFIQNHTFVDAVFPMYENPPVWNSTVGKYNESGGWH